MPLVIQNAGQIQSEIRYGYNLDGSLKTVSVQDGRGTVSQIETTYDNDGLIKSTGELQFDRNDFGAITKSSLQRVQQVSGYNGFGEKTSDKFYDISKPLAEYSYTRDNAGRINTFKESRNGVLRETYFRYDLEGRVQQVFPPRGVAPRRYSYDANGNRLSAKTVKGLVTADYDSQDRLVRYGQTVFSYSENGNLIEKIEAPRPGNWGGLNWSDAERRSQKVTSYSYDAFNNLVSVTLPNLNKIDYVYDGLRRRIGKKLNGQLIRSYVYNGPTQIVAQLNGEGKIIQRYVYGEKPNVPDLLIFSGKEYRVISDHIGSPRLVVDVSTGKVEQEIEFDEFGVIMSRKSYELPFGFAGGLHDQDTNLVHFGARDYDPEVGRWITKDPIGFGGGDTNLYGYVAGDPVNFVDPSGLSEQDVTKISNIFNQTIIKMTDTGQRTNPGWWNNISSSANKWTGGRLGHPYQGCIDQASTMQDALSGNKYDDKWIFSPAGSDLPHFEPQSTIGFGALPHHWLTGKSNNPNDPTLLIDPHKNVITRLPH